MGGKKKSKIDPHNKRLDLFLENLEIEEDKRKQIIEEVENMTFETLQQKSKPTLRLTKD
tara:strand:+ start:132 stop:308 length:177 start_codon:yes stop_codon:yes gene_type:complete